MNKMTVLNLLALGIFVVAFSIAVSNKANTVNLVNALSNGFYLGPLKLATQNA